MDLACTHLTLRVGDIEAARRFYCDQLGLTVLQSAGEFLALSAGDLRLSLFGGHDPKPKDTTDGCGISIIFRTDNINETVEALKGKEVGINSDIIEAPGFMRFTSAFDPDGNIVYFAEYL